MDALLDPLRDGVTRHALAEVLVLAALTGPLGVWIVLHRHVFAAESFAHAMLPGLVLASLGGIPLALGAAGGAVVGAGATALAGRDRRIGTETSVAIVVGALLGAGALLALEPDVPADLQSLLFGDLLGVTTGDLILTAALAATAGLALWVLHRRLTLVAFDPVSAQALGASPARVDLALLLILALALVAAVQALGNLLVIALLIAPAAAALRPATRLGPALLLATLLAASAGVLGVFVSFHFEVAAGAAVALCALALAGIVALWPRQRARGTGTRPATGIRRSPVERLAGGR